MATPSSSSGTLLFFVNGKEHQVPNPNPRQTIIEYLREQGLTGTKLGCAEGGCGACTVMLSHFDITQNKVINRSVNACLTPICSAHYCHIITVEGIGSTQDVLHPVQEALATCNGSQCGFCTPGFVMSLYTLLRNNPLPTVREIEECLDGNLCRCTGYRPILDAAQRFASSEAKKQSICPTTGKPCACSSISNPLPADEKKTSLLKNEEQCPLVGQKHLLFPHKLRSGIPSDLTVEGPDFSWYTPLTISSLLEIKRKNPGCKIVVGNSELGIDARFKGAEYPVLVNASFIPELNQIQEFEDGWNIGASVTLTNLMHYFKEQVENAKAAGEQYKTRGLQAALENLKWFASTPIRNVAAVGGNIATASPISDLNPVWSALDGQLNIINVDQKIRKVFVKNFFLDYRKVDLESNEILFSLFVPFTKENEYVRAFKQAKRREDDIAIVNACMRARVNQNQSIFEEVALSFGGMSKITKSATITEEFLRGKKLTDEVIEEAIQELAKEMTLPESVPGGMPEYRRSLTLGFFYKFCLGLKNHIEGTIAPELMSAIETFDRPISKGEQYFEVKKQGTSVGVPENHLSAKLQVSGEAIYLDDIPKQHKELQASFVLSTEPYALIKDIDASDASSVEGFVAFFTADDIPGENEFAVVIKDEQIFRKDEVTAIGQPIGIVVAETLEAAKKAARKIKVTYEKKGDAIFTIKEAIEKESYIGNKHTISDGDVDQVFNNNKSDDIVIVEGDTYMGGQEHFYLETTGALAIPGENKEMTIYASCQNVTKVQKIASLMLGIDSNKIVAKLKRIGGGFGGKETRFVFSSSACALAASKTKRPVRLILDRDTDMIHTGQRHPLYCQYKVASTKDGKLIALDAKVFLNAGYSLDLSESVMDRSILHIDNCYKFPNLRVVGTCCKTNISSNTAFRGFGGPQGMMVTEQIIDHLARVLNVDVQEVREINLYKKNDVTPFGQVLSDGDRISKLYNECKIVSNYKERLVGVGEFNQKNALKKRGISLIPTKFGIAFTAKFLNQGGALVHIYTDGSVLISHGGIEMGQGLHTKVAQVAASTLDIPLSLIHIAESSTDKVPNTSPTAASVGSDLYGAAVQDACMQLKKRLEPYKQKLGAECKFKDIVLAAYLDRVNLSAQGFFKIPDIYLDWKTGKGSPFSYFTYGSACSEVEIDTLTGDFQIIRTDIVMDVGDSLNPAIDIGQIEGAFVQGIGLFMIEELVWGDESHQWVKPGRLFTSGPGTYKIPSANDIPIDFKIHLLKNASNPKAVYSSKAIGEPPLFLSSSVFFAVKNAIASVRKDKVFVLDSPATPERIRMSCGDKLTMCGTTASIRPKGSF